MDSKSIVGGILDAEETAKAIDILAGADNNLDSPITKLNLEDEKFKEEFGKFYEVISVEFASILQSISDIAPEAKEDDVWEEAVSILLKKTRRLVESNLSTHIKKSCKKCFGTGVSHMEDTINSIPYPNICKCVKHSTNRANHHIIIDLFDEKDKKDADAEKTS